MKRSQQANEKNTLFLSSEDVISKLKSVRLYRRSNAKFETPQRGRIEPSIIISVLRPKDETEKKYDPKPTFPTALIQPDSDRTVT